MRGSLSIAQKEVEMAPLRSLAWLWGLTLLGLAGISAAQPLNPQALNAPPFAPDRVLVKFKPGTAASAVAEAHRQAGGHKLKTIPGIGVQVVSVLAGTVLAKVAAYEANPNVLYAEPDAVSCPGHPQRRAGTHTRGAKQLLRRAVVPEQHRTNAHPRSTTHREPCDDTRDHGRRYRCSRGLGPYSRGS